MYDVQGIASWLALLRLSGAVQRRLGASTATMLCLQTAAQFHVPFYASRTLPNTVALIPVSVALAHWIDGTERWLVPVLLTATTAVVRCDMLVVTGAVSLHMLATGQMKMQTLVAIGLSTFLVAVGVSTLLDSVLWGRWLWPEGNVFYFNAILGKCDLHLLSWHLWLRLHRSCAHSANILASSHRWIEQSEHAKYVARTGRGHVST